MDPKNHVFPYVYAPYSVLFINTIVRALPYPTTGGDMMYVLYVLIRTHDGPKKHVFPYVYGPHLVLFINTIVRALPYPYYGGAYDEPMIDPKTMYSPMFTHHMFGSVY